MIGTRKVTLGDTEYELSEPHPDIFELRELPAGPVLGQYTRAPAHGRNKEFFRIIGTDQQITSEKEIWYRLQSRYWRKQAQGANLVAPPQQPEPEVPVEEPPPAPIPMLTLAEFATARSVPAHRLRRLLAGNGIAGAQKTEIFDAQNHRQTTWIIPADAPLPANASRASESPAAAPAPAIVPPTPPAPPTAVASMSEPEPDLTGWLSTREAAIHSGVTHSAVQFWLKQHRIQAIHRYGRWFINPASLPQPGQKIFEVEPRPDDIPAGWLRTREAAPLYGLNSSTLGEWALRGKIPAKRGRGNIWWVAPPPAEVPMPDRGPVAIEIVPPEPLTEVAPPAPPINGNGHHAEPEPVPVLELPPLDLDLLTRLQLAEREVGRLQGETAYLRAQLADRAVVDTRRGHWWGR